MSINGPDTKAARFVISLCQSAVASNIRTLHQLHALTPKERFFRNQQAESLFAAWGTCALWLELFRKEADGGASSDSDAEEETPFDVGAVIDAISSKVKACVEEVGAYKDRKVFEATDRFDSFPEAFWFSAEDKPDTNPNALPHPLPDLVIDGIVSYWQPHSLSMASSAWSQAVSRTVASKATVESLSRASALLLYEMHYREFCGRKFGLRDLHLRLRYHHLSPRHAVLGALIVKTSLRRLRLSVLIVDAMMLLNWIAETPTMTHLELTSCTFDGSFDVNEPTLQTLCKQMTITTSIRMEYCYENRRCGGFISFLLTSLAPTLRSLTLYQNPLDFTLNVPKLDYLEFMDMSGSEPPRLPLSDLPSLKHLRVHHLQELLATARLAPNLRVLEARLFLNTRKKVEKYYAALKILPNVEVMAVEPVDLSCADRGFNYAFDFRKVKSWHISEFYNAKAKCLTGLLIDVNFTPLLVLECAGRHCKKLTHLVFRVV
ncbi:hypothetical protein HK097_010933 [Rhizophlyctis rosea]|uniref:F-box domain-containing protein n=1 Tax=Rhizophlyctis rosea TaxID=64517 RepID=A0AAD5X3E9_9FUNG|nr:hypothetical protein HK097_010933 [Rhizophlyctis rosea]